MRHLTLVLTLLVSATALAAMPERVPTLVVTPAGRTGDPVAKALRDRGVDVVRPVARGKTTDLGSIARSTKADATVQVGVRNRSARLTVVGADGDVRFDGTVPIAGKQPTPDEAGALAALALQSLAPPEMALVPVLPAEEGRPQPPPGPPNVAGHPPPATEGEVSTNKPNPELAAPGNVLPDPDTLGLARLWAAPNLSWRNQSLRTTAGLPALDFQTSSPYVGIGLGGEWYPFGGALRDRLGFGLSYSYSRLTLHTTGAPDAASSEHRGQGDVIWRVPAGVFGDLGLHAGLVYEGFLVPEGFPVVSSIHISPRLGFDWNRRLVGPLDVFAGLGVRPFAWTGSEARARFGNDAHSAGLDGGVGIGGPTGIPGVRWNVGYGYLRYEDTYTGTSHTNQTESVHRLGIGLSYDRRL